jgi:hypothetical protein
VPGALLAVTGASRRFVGLLAGGVIAGFGIFAISGLADIYGASGLPGGDPVTLAPSLETKVGGVYVNDPLFRYRFFLDQGVQGRLGAWKLGGAGLSALDDRNSQVRLTGGFRGWGPGPGQRARDGSFLDLDLALSRHFYGPESFSLWSGDVLLNGRLDLARVGPTLKGSFAEMGVGWALQVYQYRVPGAVADINELLLARFAFGWYLGRPGGLNGEVAVGYDHRHDGLAAGLKLRGLGSGVAGHFEARGRVFRGAWFTGGFTARVAMGSRPGGGFQVTPRERRGLTPPSRTGGGFPVVTWCERRGLTPPSRTGGKRGRRRGASAGPPSRPPCIPPPRPPAGARRV